MTSVTSTHDTSAKPPGANLHNGEPTNVPVRRRMPDERTSITHRFRIGEHQGYIIVGMYANGEPGELFITMAKVGSSVSGLVSSFAQVVSIALQHGVPLAVLCEKFAHTRFEPSGFTGNPEIPNATSIMDYVFRWLSLRFVDRPLNSSVAPENLPVLPATESARSESGDAPFCIHCGTLTVRVGSCFTCGNCGAPTGCS
jgi:ribonucleoside-diphosphate reductase alpha chain